MLTMSSLFLLACLACACDAHRVQTTGEIAQTLQAYSWESKNFALYSAGDLNDAELGLKNLMDAVNEPSALTQMVQMLNQSENFAVMKRAMTSPSFRAQAKRSLQRSAVLETVKAQEHGSKSGVHTWERDNAASYKEGTTTLAELGAANLQAAVNNPSVIAEALQMLREEENIGTLRKMSSDPRFQQEASRVAKEAGKKVKDLANKMTANSDAPQSFTQVSEVTQDGAKAAWLPVVANPVTGFTAPAPLSHGLAAHPARSSDVAMQIGRDWGKITPAANPEFVKNLAGVSAPLGYWDPLGLAEGASEGKIRFFREAELKHGRVAMLAALGWLVAEGFHPIFPGNNVPSLRAFQETPLQNNLPLLAFLIGISEALSIFTFNSPFGGEPWTIRTDYAPGDLGWDPLGVKNTWFPGWDLPGTTNEKGYKDMQTKEINNGRLAMLGIAGMAAQELVTGQKLFGGG